MSSPTADEPPRNPVGEWFQGWSSRTPPITRCVIMTIVGLFLLSVLTGQNAAAFLSCPYFVIFHFELYRLLLASFFQSGLISVAFVAFAFSGVGAKLESALGSLGFLSSLMTLSIVTNMLHSLLCVTLAYNPVSPMPTALMDCAGGFWSVFLALTVIECSIYPEETRRLLFLPVNIPTKFYPLALLAFFSLFSGFMLVNGLGVAAGYMLVNGYLSSIASAPSSLASLEARAGVASDGQSTGGGDVGRCASCFVGFVKWLSGLQGYISASAALGAEVFAPRDPLGQAESGTAPVGSAAGGRAAGGSAVTNSRGGGFWPNGEPGSSSASSPSAVFSGSGRALGSTSGGGGSSFLGSLSPSGNDPKAARLAALAAAERRLGGTNRNVSVPSESADASEQWEKKIQQLQALGYSPDASNQALNDAEGDVDLASAILGSQ